jgi:hypothetical protein
MLDLQGRTIRYSILKREVDTNRSLYDGLLQRLKEVGRGGGATINNISVVDKAQVPLFPYKPSLSRNVSLGMMIGLMLGLMVAWLLEHLDDSIRFVEDVERETHAAVLGVVPMLKGAMPPSRRRSRSAPHRPTSALRGGLPLGAHRAAVLDLRAARRAGWSSPAAPSTRARARPRSRSRSTSRRWASPCSSSTPTCATRCCTSSQDHEQGGLSNYLSGSLGRLEGHAADRDPAPLPDDHGPAAAQSGGAALEHQAAEPARRSARSTSRT